MANAYSGGNRFNLDWLSAHLWLWLGHGCRSFRRVCVRLDERWALSASPDSVEAVGVDFAADSGDDLDTSVFNDDSAQQTAAQQKLRPPMVCVKLPESVLAGFHFLLSNEVAIFLGLKEGS
jgi:hypothetical protein